MSTKGKERRIVLYEPNYWGPRRKVQRAPLALLAISGTLVQEGYQIDIISQALYPEHEKRLLEACQDALCLGVTALTGLQILDGLRVSRMVKERYPHLPIVWGGWHGSIEPEETLKSPYIDILVRGQGERAFPELVHALEDNRALSNISGISYKVDGQTVHGPERALEDINHFPPMPYHLIDVEKVLSTDEYGSRVLNYVSSYGCPYKCAFCAEWQVHNRKWTGLESLRIADDFERFVRDYHVDCVGVNDTQFFLSKDRVRLFCEELLRRNLKVNWDNVQGNIRQILKWEDELWELMVRSGLRSLLVGAESGWPEALRFVNKPLTVEETIKFAEKCRKYDIKVLYSMILGLPWDPDYKVTQRKIDTEIKLTLELCDKLISLNDHNRILLCIYTPYAGNPFYRRALDIGLKPPGSLEGWGDWTLGKRTTPWLLPSQARKIDMISSYIFFFLDSTSYGWVAPRIRNPLKRALFRAVFLVFTGIAKLRWRWCFFAFPVDFWIYRWGREILGIA